MNELKDQNIEFQQNLAALPFAIFLSEAVSD